MTETSEKINLSGENAVVKESESKTLASTINLDAFKEASFEIKTRAEIPVISKTARFVEEVVISKETVERAETVRDSVRRTEVEVEDLTFDDPAANRKI